MRQLRGQQSLSQTELARRLGTSQPTLSALEQGRRNPGLDTIFKICDVLKISVTMLAETVDEHMSRG